MSIKKNFFAPLSSGLGATRRAAMLLLVMMLTTVTTWADNYVTLTSTTKTWENGKTYETNADVTIANRITVTGNVTLILTDGYILTASKGIEVSEGNSLTIEGGTNGTGKLIIEGCAEGKSGIGGSSGTPAKYGNITINGGIVNVKGGAKGGAGIGGNKNSSITGNGTITITGGIVNATGGTGAAGIGGVIYGNIIINGGIVNVKGGVNGAGIGGNNNSRIDGNGTITINGGIVNATGGDKAAGIGGGCGSNMSGAYGGCGAIVINGGQVTATGGGDGPGIGPGRDGDDNTSGSLVLGWTNTSDFIKVTGVTSNVTAYGFSHRLGSISFAEEDKKFKIVGGGEATTDNIKNKVSVELIPKGSEQHQLSVATISGISASYDLTGSSLDIPFSVIDAEGKTLTLGTDYTATLGTTSQESPTIHITEGGKYTLTITGMGSYVGSKSVDFEVVSIGFKKDANGVDYINMPKTGIYDADIPEGVSSFKVYDDGGAKAQYSNNYDGGLVLTAPDHHVLQLTGTVTAEVQVNNPLDYLMVYDGGSTSAQKIGDKYGSDESGEDIGTLISSGKQMTLTFHSDNSGQRDGLNLKVTLKRDLGSCVIANIEDQTYTGSAIEPAVTVTDGETTLTLGTDYEVAYSNNISAGTATITITGKKNYAKTTSKTFNIVKATPTVTALTAVADLEYKGSEQELVTKGDTDFGTLLYSLDGTNYSDAIPTATDAGTYTVYYKVAGDANHKDVSGSIEVTIASKAVTNDDITITIPSQVWTGSELTPVITVKDGETELIKNTDYTVTAPSGTIQDAGDYTYTISGKGNYSGEKAATFTIMQPKDIATCDITVPNQTMERFGGGDPYPYIYFKFEDAEYNPTSNVIGEVVTDGEKTLTLGTDYEFGMITFDGPSTHEEKINPCKPGDKCLVEIVGIGDYGGSKWVSFKITYPDANGTWGDLTWAFHDGTLTISGTGAMNATEDNYPWRSIASYVETITIGDGITSIAANAFAGTQDENPYSSVTTISLPSTLTTIGDYAFAYCIGATITVPTSVTTLGSNPFNEVGCVVVSTPLVDGNDNSDMISKMSSAKNATFTYKRSFTANVASTVCLPFAHTPSSEGTYYTFTAIDKETSPWTVTMTSTAASLTANTPYMFMPAVGEVSFSGTASSFNPSNVEVNDPKVDGGKWNLIGTYESRLWDNSNNTGEIGSVYGFAAQSHNGGSYTVNPGDFVKAMAGASIAPFRAYLKYTAPVSNAPRRGAAEEALPSRMSVRLVNADGDVTAIGTIDTKTGEIRFDSDAWYTLDGRRLNGKPSLKGMYINNGKKIIVK